MTLTTLLFCLATIVPESFLHTQENKIERAERLAPFFEALDEAARPVRIVHLGDSHVRGHVFPVATREALVSEWGGEAMEEQQIGYKTTALATETGEPGLVYHAMGINGAICSHFNKEEYLAQVAGLQPDLIILSFGTNEAHWNNYTAEAHVTEMDGLVQALQARCPEAVVLLTTPPGSYRSTRVKSYRNGRVRYAYKRTPNLTTPSVVATLQAYAEERNLPLWDLYAAVGGEKYALRNWTGAQLMRPDRIHYTDAGYTVMGRLLAEALVKARMPEKQARTESHP